MRNALIRLAYTMHEGSQDRRILLTAIQRMAKDDWAQGKKFKHPETGNEVAFVSLPPEEQKRLRENHEEQDFQEKTDQSFGSRVKRLLKGIKNVSAPVGKALTEASEDVQKMLLDDETRKKSLGAIAKKMKTGAPFKKMFEAGVHEAKEIKHALKATAKLFKKPPGPFTKEDRKALYGAGAYVAGATLAAIPPGGALMATAALGKSFALHVGVKAVSHIMDKGLLHFEWAESFNHLFHVAAHVAAEADETEKQKALTEILGRSVAEILGNLDDKDIEKILQGAKPPEES